MEVPSHAAYPPPGTLETMATPGAHTPTCGPQLLKFAANTPANPIGCASALCACRVSIGHSPSLPTAATESTPGTLPGNCTGPPELPAPTMQAMPLSLASLIFCTTSSE